jgi:hypothetical protein
LNETNKSRFNLDNYYYEEKNKLFNSPSPSPTQLTHQKSNETKSSNFNSQINFSSLITTTRFLNLNQHSPSSLLRHDSKLSLFESGGTSVENLSVSSNLNKYGSSASLAQLNNEYNVDASFMPYVNKRNSLLVIDNVAATTLITLGKQTGRDHKRNSIHIENK